jgi:hypothetical protein
MTRKLTFEEIAYDKGYRQALKESEGLIAAAPELLEALKAVVAQPMTYESIEAARAAIAKAEGE